MSEITFAPSGKSKQLAFTSLLLVLVALVLCTAFKPLVEQEFLIGWTVIYALSAVYLFGRISREFYAPDVVLLVSYLFLLGAGSVLYSYIRGTAYWPYGTNLFGIGYIALWIGTVIPRIRFSSRRRNSSIDESDRLKMKGLYILLILVAFAAVVILFVVSGVPILATDVNEAKLQFFSGKGFLSIFFRGLPVISLAYCYNAMTQPTDAARYRSHAIALSVSAVILLTGYRAITVIFIAMYVSMVAFLSGWKPKTSTLVVLGSLAILFLGTMGAYRRQDLSISGIVTELGILVTARPAISDDIIRNFGEQNYFLGSRYLADLVKLLPGSQTGANVDLKYELFANAAHMPELAGITPGMPAESFMNFGAWWIPLSLFLVGYAANAAFSSMKSAPTVTRSLFYFTLVYNLAGAIQTGIATKLVHFVYIWLWIIVVSRFFKWRLR